MFPMQPKPLYQVFVATLISAVGGISSAFADLPSLPEKPWLEYFLVSENRSFIFAFNNWAGGNLIPAGKGGKEISIQYHLPVTFVIEEVLPTGATVTKKILPESLETKDKATLKPGKISFRGKVTGDASFEGFVEVERGIISVGGRLLDPGTLTKNPLRFGVRVTVPDVYRNAKKPGKEGAKDAPKDAAKEFAKKIKDDRYSMVWTDGKRVKFDGTDKIEADPKNVNGPGIKDLKVEIAPYQGKSLEFSASENSKIALWTRLEQPFSDGFSINWYPDPAKDPETKARLKFTVK
jgi:hypothetical protein